MSSLAQDLLLGPAVVVDDEVNQANTVASSIVEELHEAHFPVLRRRVIPHDAEIAHWQTMSLIILDWDLLGTAGSISDSGASDESTALLGMTLPDSVRRGPQTDSLRFVQKLMEELYCPVFIISNHDIDTIWTNLKDGLDEDETEYLMARVLIRSKVEAQGSLLEELSAWIAKHPAIYALKTWERGYDRAKAALFDDFQRSAVEWPGILWRTSSEDGVNPNHDLTETISRNLLHRIGPHLFKSDLILSSRQPESLDSVRKVLYQQAVVPASRLHADVIMPGDFFVEDDAQQSPPETINICLTPACDLVPRDGGADDIRMFMVQASLVGDEDLTSRKAIKDKLRSSDSTNSVLLHHLVPEDAMYIVRFKDWSVTTWGQVRNLRRGRLLDPYITLLQQRNALFSQRQGLPRLPDNFYEPRSV